MMDFKFIWLGILASIHITLAIYMRPLPFLSTIEMMFLYMTGSLPIVIGFVLSRSITHRKRLLILDMNNLLVYRVFIPSQAQEQPETLPYNHLATVSPNGRFYTWRRPGLDAFIDYCLANFDVAVWSSARRENVEHLIDMVFGKVKRNLLVFVWDQQKCDQISPHPDGVTTDKPLFVKRIDNVWKHFGKYDKNNTILADDSKWKTMYNPPSTVFTMQPWYPHKGDGMNDTGLEEIQKRLEKLK